MAKIETGSQVSIRFSLFLADIDRLVDTTGADGKFEFVIGEGSIIPGLEKHLIGLEPGDKGRFEIPCEEAYGPALEDEDLVQKFTENDFPKEMELEPGLVIGFQSPNGDETPGTITKIQDNVVTVDFSHPLAGYDLVFEVEVLDVKPAA
ncbi:MAG: peptidylprolyl isomerase [Acidiferrobacterales bacterium]|nr:peptidylprolyl isomerase [Acidiferrobacterales bacterium]